MANAVDRCRHLTEDRTSEIDRLLHDHEAMDAAIAASVRQAIVRHKRLGHSIVAVREGQVVEIPPEEIPEDGVFPPEA